MSRTLLPVSPGSSSGNTLHGMPSLFPPRALLLPIPPVIAPIELVIPPASSSDAFAASNPSLTVAGLGVVGKLFYYRTMAVALARLYGSGDQRYRLRPNSFKAMMREIWSTVGINRDTELQRFGSTVPGVEGPLPSG